VLVNFLQALLAILLGNLAYFVLLPWLPAVARHRPFHLDLGTLLDFFFCVVRSDPHRQKLAITGTIPGSFRFKDRLLSEPW
jgi:hypothetical protein